MIRKFLPQFCLVVAGCTITFLLAEGFVRIFYPHSRDHVIPGGLFEIDHDLGWKLKAKASGRHHTRYFDVMYRINELGYRDKLRNTKKPKDTYRFLLFGDSQIFGWGNTDKQRFSNLVENRGQSIEVLNFGVPGYGLDQQILSYQRDGLSFDADEVIFFASKDTLKRIHHDYIYKKPKPRFVVDTSGDIKLEAAPQKGSGLTKILYNILHPFYLPYFVEQRLAILNRSLQQSSKQLPKKAAKSGLSIGELERGILGRLNALAQAQQHRLTVLAFLPKDAKEALEQFCQENGIDFMEIMLDGASNAYIFGPQDRHWTPAANQQIAKQLQGLFRARGNQLKAGSSAL